MPEQFVTVKINTKNNALVDVKMTLTIGKLLSIVNALENHSTPVGQDVLIMFQKAMQTGVGL